MNKEAMKQASYEIQQSVENLMNSIRVDMEYGVKNMPHHYYSERLHEIAYRLRFFESEYME